MWRQFSSVPSGSGDLIVSLEKAGRSEAMLGGVVPGISGLAAGPGSLATPRPWREVFLAEIST